MLQTPNQIYIMPNVGLREYVAHYTITFASDPQAWNSVVPESLTLIPDGSGCLIFTYDGFSFTSVLWGATTKTCIVKNDGTSCPMRVFIEFLPGGLFGLTGIKQTDLTNLQIPIGQIMKGMHSLVADAFEQAQDLSSFLNRLDEILLSYMENNPVPKIVLTVRDQIKRSGGCLSVKQISNMEFYSQRHLNRIFNEYIGINLKTYSSIVRINQVIKELGQGNQNILDVAQTSEFYDQAHFNHTFKSICGTSPKKYLDRMSEFYNEPFKF